MFGIRAVCSRSDVIKPEAEPGGTMTGLHWTSAIRAEVSTLTLLGTGSRPIGTAGHFFIFIFGNKDEGGTSKFRGFHGKGSNELKEKGFSLSFCFIPPLRSLRPPREKIQLIVLLFNRSHFSLNRSRLLTSENSHLASPLK